MKRGAMVVSTILVGLAAAAGVFLYVQNVRQQTEQAQRTVDVVVATTDIPANQDLDELISAGLFVETSVPQDDLVRSAITEIYQLEGQRTAYPILAGEQISAARLQGALQAEGGRFGLVGDRFGLSLTLEPQRAAGGLLQEGDHVQAFGTFRAVHSPESQITRVLVRDALVLSVARDAESGRHDVTLLLSVTPLEAELLIYAQEQGHVWLTLLPPNHPGAVIPAVRSKDLVKEPT